MGSGIVSRKIAHPVPDIPASVAYEAMMKNKEAGAVAAFDRVPFSYLSANFTFNTDNCVRLNTSCTWIRFYCFPESKLTNST